MRRGVGMPNSANSIPIGQPNPAQAQIIYMSILTAARNGDFDTAQMIVAEFELTYGSLIPLFICGISFGNSLVDAYAEALEQSPEQIMQKLALDSLSKKENPS